ncbi:uncharacterized protein BcabD6B2_17170 [Babesia caballi]|uniref:Uncharacterized protein n=1 Tax=Babesia caballi TaxID=5871 RepID=A0AAV4LR60_BABCB|nr:hypothetical protein, conserved [Babesia caballi]
MRYIVITLPIDTPLSALVDPYYDCPSNLKEAVDWILRVTGKDGGGGSGDGTDALTKQVKTLLESVKGFDAGTGVDIQKVISALNNGDIVTKLAEGLQQFIGYKSGSNPHGHITGAGIAPSNIATHRLCDAAIAFTIGVLEGCKSNHYKGVVLNDSKYAKINEAIKHLQGCYGQGPKGFTSAASKIKNALQDVKGNVRSFLVDVGSQFQTFDTNVKSQTQPSNVAQKIGDYLKGVFKGSGNGWGGDAEQAATKLQTLVQKFKSNNAYDTSDSTFPQNIRNVENNLITNNAISAVKPILTAGKNAFMGALKMPNYMRMDYKGADSITWTAGNNDVQTCAKIFLGCLPLYYQALTYLYWKCAPNSGGWNAMTLGGGPLKDFLYSMWYDPSKVNVVKRGSDLVTFLDGKFADFEEQLTSQNRSYPHFLKELHGNAKQKLSNAATDCPLSALFYGASCYFTCKQSQIATPNKSPSTIREMLYFLAALPFSSSYERLEKHIENLLPNELDVADSASSKSGADKSSDEPWLHSLFSNSEFKLNYPMSGSAIFNALSNYTYALQFQLTFLYKQCVNGFSDRCGWLQCKFGSTINQNFNGSVQSWLCSTPDCEKFYYCQHNSDSCNHYNNCGSTASQASPLQAFLTDDLIGFLRDPSASSDHMAQHPPGSMCHVPMGFKNHTRQESVGGYDIFYVVKPFCERPTSPLRQLSEKLGCLTKRTPRTLGDLFGFIWHLNGQLFKTRPTPKRLAAMLVKALETNSHKVPQFLLEILTGLAGSAPQSHSSPSVLSRSFETMAPAIPFLYRLFMAEDFNSLPGTLFDLNQHCHEKENKSDAIVGGQKPRTITVLNHKSGECTTSPNDLWSIFQPVALKPSQPGDTDTHAACRGKDCGGYLYPLTSAHGTTFAPKHASAYLTLGSKRFLMSLCISNAAPHLGVSRANAPPASMAPHPANVIPSLSAAAYCPCYIAMVSTTTVSLI